MGGFLLERCLLSCRWAAVSDVLSTALRRRRPACRFFHDVPFPAFFQDGKKVIREDAFLLFTVLWTAPFYSRIPSMSAAPDYRDRRHRLLKTGRLLLS